MTARNRSSVFFHSNVLPVEDTFHDQRLLSRITDPAALERLGADPDFKLTKLTPLQQEILNKCGIHCIYAEKGDYPWGIPVGSHEGAKAVCLCTQTRCALFSKCRPDFTTQNNQHTGRQAINDPVEPSPLQKVGTSLNSFNDKEEDRWSVRDAECGTPDGDFIFEPDIAPVAPSAGDAQHCSTRENNIILQTIEENLQKTIAVKATPPANLPDNVPSDGECLQEEAREECPEKIASSGALTADSETPESVINDVSGPTVSVTSCSESGLPGCECFVDFIPANQADVIGLPASARVLVNAPPGTGKTWTLNQRIRYLVEKEAVQPEQILVLTFTRAATAVIRERIGDAAQDEIGIADIDIGTLDSFAFSLLNQRREAAPDLCPNTVGMSYEEGIIAARNHISACRDQQLLGGYAHVIIDEIQDLSGSRAELIMELLASLPSRCGLTLLGDSCQAIYDWRKDNGGSSVFSMDLYKWLMAPERGITRYITFCKDYRRCGEGLPDTEGYRRAILTGEKSGIGHQLNALLDTLKHPVKDLGARTLHKILKSYPADETLGILTRSNGMALVVSSQLSHLGIAHTRLEKPKERSLANWLADIFADWGHNTIHRDEFTAKFMELYGKTETEEMADACWNALVRGRSSGRQEIRDLLAAISGNREPLLWREAGAVRPFIEVGNVFRAKGREYDNVVLIEELFDRGGSFGDDDGAITPDEDRVRYVALTRARKRMVRLPNPPDSDYLYKDKQCGGRIFKSGRIRGHGFKPMYIAFFEVGVEGDIEPESFAAMPLTQEYIVQFAAKGAHITLEKMPSRMTGGVPRYEVCTWCDDVKYVIGSTGECFKESLERSLQRIYQKPHKNIQFRNYPDSMSKVYVTGRNSHVSVWSSTLKGAARFEDMAIWRGITCQGFAVTYSE